MAPDQNKLTYLYWRTHISLPGVLCVHAWVVLEHVFLFQAWVLSLDTRWWHTHRMKSGLWFLSMREKEDQQLFLFNSDYLWDWEELFFFFLLIFNSWFFSTLIVCCFFFKDKEAVTSHGKRRKDFLFLRIKEVILLPLVSWSHGRI